MFFKDPPTCSFILSDSPSGLNFTCSIWNSNWLWYPRLYIKGPGIERYTGDPGVRTVSQEVQPDHEGMVYECGAVFEWLDLESSDVNFRYNPHRYDLNNLPVIKETCSTIVGMTNPYISSTKIMAATITRNEVLQTTGTASIISNIIQKIFYFTNLTYIDVV